jgi:methionyl-tRNA formyltransferase
MKIAVFIRNGLIGNIILNHLVPQMMEMGVEPVFFNTGEPQNKKSDHAELNKIGFLETSLMKDIVEPFYLENKKNKDGLTNLSNKALALTSNLSYFDVPDVNDLSFIEKIVGDKDIVGSISIRILQIFKPDIIRAFEEKGFMWNLHTGLLPKYKGVHIPYWAIENNEKYYGWTLHNIDKGIDTGDIIATDQLPLDQSKPVLDTYLDMADKGAAMIMGALMFYKARGTIPAKPQTTDKESYFTFPTSAEMQRWNEKGIIFCDDIVGKYTSLFTARGSIEENVLRGKLEEAVRSHTLIEKKTTKTRKAA